MRNFILILLVTICLGIILFKSFPNVEKFTDSNDVKADDVLVAIESYLNMIFSLTKAELVNATEEDINPQTKTEILADINAVASANNDRLK
jgi:hypothetical protein